MAHRSPSNGSRYQEAPADLPARPPSDNEFARSRQALVGGSHQFRSSTSMIDVPQSLKKVEAMASSWQNMRDARRKAVSTAQEQCIHLLREAQEAITGAPSSEASFDDREDVASATSLDSNGRDEVGQLNSRGRRRGNKYKCQVRSGTGECFNLQDALHSERGHTPDVFCR
jgi:hypothetical protein